MTLSICEHPDTIVVHDSSRECPLCEALSHLTDAQTAIRDSGLIAAATLAAEALHEPWQCCEHRELGQRLALEVEHATEEREPS